MTTIVTLTMDAASQAAFDHLREQHYPPHLNRIAAHLTLFHALPDSDDVRTALAEHACTLKPFSMRVTQVLSLGRGVAYRLQSPELTTLHASLSRAFQQYLTPQDKQPFRPHVVVQNKTSGVEAKALLNELSKEFTPWEVTAEGLAWWNYLGGPWQLRESFTFG